jgi:hypothetical protein
VDATEFNKVIRVEDVNQGWLGDCYLIGAIASLAHTLPRYLRKAIRKGAGPGEYIVRLHNIGKNGHYYGVKEIPVNNWFPSRNDHILYGQGVGKPTRNFMVKDIVAGERPLWPAIIEKAFAQMNGGYDALNLGGWEKDVFMAITGKPAIEVPLGRPGNQQNEVAMEQVKSALKQGLPITAASKGRSVLKKIYACHVYVVVGVDDKHVYLRNPHDTRPMMSLTTKNFIRAFGTITVACV